MNKTLQSARPFTGYHMLAWIITFFGIIIGVNVTMAYFANSTWSGLVVANSYVASQEFNGKLADVKAQDALGWKDKLTAINGSVSYAITKPDGTAVPATSVKVTFRRPVTDTADFTLTLLKAADGIWSAPHVLGDGAWIAEVDVASDLFKQWRDTLRLTVKDGAIR
jgi:nitrogen fixation protein FixH